jgi:hypothetical protein
MPDGTQLQLFAEVLANWQLIYRHLGRRRAFWDHLLDGWRRDGLIAAG